MKEKQATGRPGPRRREDLMERICRFTQDNLAEKITLRDVAKHCGVSISTVTQQFQKTIGTTFHRYLTQLRMEKAAQLIWEGVPLEEAGRRVGYMDHSSFYRAFCQNFGQSPRDYRRSLAEK